MPASVIQPNRNELSVERGLDRAIEIRQQLERVFGWRKRLSPEMRRASNAAQLLFQVIGVAGYAGYFASMHTFMRVVSGTLMVAAWYGIYWWKALPKSPDQ